MRGLPELLSHEPAAEGHDTPETPAAAPDAPETRPEGSDLGQPFDADFYRAHYPDLAGMSADDARSHFIEYGLAEGRIGAPVDPGERPDGAPLPPDFNVFDYVFANPDLVGKFRDHRGYIAHYLTYGVTECRAYQSGHRDEAFLRAVGRRARGTAKVLGGPDGGDPATVPYPSALHALRFAGIFDFRLLDLFDYEFYFYSVMASEGRYSDTDRFRCVIHFAEQGIRSHKPIRRELVFDPQFWLELKGGDLDQGDGTVFDLDTRVYLDWLNHGLPNNLPPNGAAWLKSELGVAFPPLSEDQLAAYEELNQDLSGKANVARHYIEYGQIESRSGAVPDVVLAPYIVEYADRLIDKGRSSEAERLYRRINFLFPEIVVGRQHLADHFLRSGRTIEALTLYAELIERRKASHWTFLNAASCCRTLNFYEQALRVTSTAREVYPGDQRVVAEHRRASEAYFWHRWAVGLSLANLGNIRGGQDEIIRAVEAVSRPRSRPARPHRIRSVAIVANLDIPQCALYRVEQKAEQIAEAGFKVSIFDQAREGSGFLHRLHEFEAAIFYRCPAFPALIALIDAARETGLVTFYDIDDAIFERDIYPGPIEEYGDLIAGAEYSNLAIGVPLFAAAMRRCDHFIASTEPLADLMRPYNERGSTFVHPNGMGYRHQAAMRAHPVGSDPGGSTVTIFYGTGTKAHKKDFRDLLEPALDEVCRRFGDRVRVVIAGYDALSGDHPFLASCVESLPYSTDWVEYIAHVSTASINLSVLERSPFTDAKSEIKWLEAAMFKVPSVVSRNPVFEAVIADGVDGFLCSSTADYVRALSALISDPELRARMGELAHRKALDRFSARALSANIGRILSAVDVAREAGPKLLIVNVFYEPQRIGGATRVVSDNVRELRKIYGDRCEIEIFTSVEGSQDQPYRMTSYAADGIRVTAVSAPPRPEMDVYDPAMESLFADFLETSRPSLVHFHCIQRLTSGIVRAARRASIPYVVTMHDGWWISDHQFLLGPSGSRMLYDYSDETKTRFACGSNAAARMAALMKPLADASAILSVSEPFCKVLRAAGLKQAITVENGVSTHFEKVARQGPEGRVVIGHLGGLEHHKGAWLLRYALEAGGFSNLDAVVVDHAKPAGHVHLERWGTTTVKIVSKVEQTNVSNLYAGIDVLVAPSIWDESYGLVTREALASGCWVIASDRGSIGEPIIEGRNGFIVSVDGIGGLLARLRDIDENPARYTQRPDIDVTLRRSEEQAQDLAVVYERCGLGVTRSGEDGELCHIQATAAS